MTPLKFGLRVSAGVFFGALLALLIWKFFNLANALATAVIAVLRLSAAGTRRSLFSTGRATRAKRRSKRTCRSSWIWSRRPYKPGWHSTRRSATPSRRYPDRSATRSKRRSRRFDWGGLARGRAAGRRRADESAGVAQRIARRDAGRAAWRQRCENAQRSR